MSWRASRKNSKNLSAQAHEEEKRMLNPKYLANGQEQYEAYVSNISRRTEVQYDYRHTNGELFSCVRPTLDACRKAKEEWLKKKTQPHK